MFNWNDLVYFLELARRGRLMPAARRLKVDHTTVSRRIFELEKSLSVKLFDRKPDGFLLTEKGHQLLAIAERIEQDTLAIQESVSAAPSAPTGRVRVATMEGIGAFYLAGRFAQLAVDEPGLMVELVTERHLINLTKREADVSVSFVPLAGQRLSVRKIGAFRLALYAAQSYLDRHGTPGGRAELADHAFVDYVEDLVFISPVHWLNDVLEPTNVVFRSTSLHGQQCAVAAGAGIALLPLFSAKTRSDLIPLLHDDVIVMRDIYLSTHEDLEYTGRVRAVTRKITNMFRDDHRYLTEFDAPIGSGSSGAGI
ncbi:transcriptional regulator [Methylopila jiangsuensis]|uniref:Transcriptional regulator n=1 Tax=Methylopila jiangsuensis TaxID=586230 RepID=A0A9W6JD38_9HYPH|nr:LysR family transcriptional regulator [Methylopila jiangsuensis]MDR6285601.1 DNA-binding transcriptional LysR family regulator [Methylopila jiangsuensis]GLK75360.1 transcriptional regulator [Methylopila jiangsuensis]